jgi:hypothetical protein
MHHNNLSRRSLLTGLLGGLTAWLCPGKAKAAKHTPKLPAYLFAPSRYAPGYGLCIYLFDAAGRTRSLREVAVAGPPPPTVAWTKTASGWQTSLTDLPLRPLEDGTKD